MQTDTQVNRRQLYDYAIEYTTVYLDSLRTNHRKPQSQHFKNQKNHPFP